MPQPNQPPPSPSQHLTWGQKIETAAYWARFPALTLMVFLRRDLGYRVVNPLWLIGVAILMAMIAGLSDPNHRPDDLVIFALMALTLGFYQRYNRWLDLRRGVKSHTYYSGTSIFRRLHWPSFLRCDRRICRTVDPLVCGMTGIVLMQFSRALGLWIVFASVCLAGFEEVAFRKQFHRDLDTLDGMVNAEIQGETVEHFSPPTDAQAQEASEGIPTGLGDDIKERIKKTKP
jgi:hypothetical protein